MAVSLHEPKSKVPTAGELSSSRYINDVRPPPKAGRLNTT